ncbi:MAG: DUF2959 family protein [Planctomycetota bacterium]|jgi:hypothetical protein
MTASFRTVLLSFALAALCAGCTATGTERAQVARIGLHAAHARLADARLSAVEAQEALEALLATSSGDLVPVFDEFEKSVDALRAQAEAVSRLPERLRARGDAYFDQWEQDLTRVHDPSLRATSASRRGEALAAYNGVVGTMWTAQTVFDPLLSLMRDVRVVLGNDLTAGGLDSVRGMSERVAHENATVAERLDGLMAEVEVVADALSSSLPES